MLPEALLAQVLALPEQERGALAVRLLRSLEAEDDDSLSAEEWVACWDPEIEQRVAEIRAGKVELVEADVVLAEARAIVAARRP